MIQLCQKMTLSVPGPNVDNALSAYCGVYIGREFVSDLESRPLQVFQHGDLFSNDGVSVIRCSNKLYSFPLSFLAPPSENSSKLAIDLVENLTRCRMLKTEHMICNVRLRKPEQADLRKCFFLEEREE